jgi:hypothetical protein
VLSKLRILLLILLGPLLAGAGSVVLQVVASGEVSSWSAVLSIGVLVAVMTCWAEWRSLLTLWRES